jgi:hypothetical protein
MPPQQPDRLLDLFNEAFDFSAHGFSDLRGDDPLLTALFVGCNGTGRKVQTAFYLRVFFTRTGAHFARKHATKARRFQDA